MAILSKIDILSPDIRDTLLRRNLILSATIEKYGNRSWANGLGIAATVGDAENKVIQGDDSIGDGVFYRDLNVIKNRYNNDSETRDDLAGVITDDVGEYYNKTQNGQYGVNNANLINNPSTSVSIERNLLRNQYNKLDELETASIDYNTPIGDYTGNGDYFDSPAFQRKTFLTQAGDVVGTLLSGQQVGFSPDGVVPNFNIRNTLAGRVLGATGLIEDTKLGQEAQKGLAFAMLNNISANAQQQTIGRINTSVTNLASNGFGSVITPDNEITVPKSGIGKATNLLQRITGIEVPRSFLPEEASIFDYNALYVRQEHDSQSLIDNTGTGQRNALFRNLNANIANGKNFGGGYAPAYTDPKNSKNGVSQPREYRTQTDTSGNTDNLAWYNSYENPKLPYTWGGYSYNSFQNEPNLFNEKTLLKKTFELFKDKKIKTMVNVHQRPEIATEISSTVMFGQDQYASKGNAVLSPNPDLDTKIFCRTWSTLDRYGNLNTLQKHRGLYPSGGAGVRLSNSKLSVLDDNGFVRVSPKSKDSKEDGVKRFMFSLENLAWKDNTDKLLDCEIGPNGGRIMWFPPYDLKFNDTTSNNLESTEFIGRGEPVYTYNNSTRTGSLSFKVIVDHSTAINNIRQQSIDDINRFLFGCSDLDALPLNISTETKAAIEAAKAKQYVPETKVDNTTHNKQLTYYFPNDVSNVASSISLGYEDCSGNPVGDILGEYGNSWNNAVNTKTNCDFINGYADILKYVNDNDTAAINIKGYATSHGSKPFNKELATNRANDMKLWLKGQAIILGYELDDDKFIQSIVGDDNVEMSDDNTDSNEAKAGRKASIQVTNKPSKSQSNAKTPTISDNDTISGLQLKEEALSGFFCESSVFEYINEESQLVYDSLKDSFKEQIKHFHPAFHSITPEGFNSRLTFLHQCMRQGPTGDGTKTPSNLAFGRPPVCVLRIGDFYHTRIMIDNLDLQYNDVQWDMNPEGIGLQPMIVDVSISFKFLGGSSLEGPITKLQNAVSFNFFANTEMYDYRADRTKPSTILKTETQAVVSTDKVQPNVEQVVNNDINNSGKQSGKETKKSDDEILNASDKSLFILEGGNDTVQVVLTNSELTDLTKGYPVQLKLSNSNGNNVLLKTVKFNKPDSDKLTVNFELGSGAIDQLPSGNNLFRAWVNNVEVGFNSITV